MNLLYKAQTRFLFHAHIKIKLSAFYEDSIFNELFSILEDIDKRYNSYQPGSYIDQINKYSGSFVQVDDEAIKILKQVLILSDFFDGAYDITIMPLIRLWGFYKEEQIQIPQQIEIDRIKTLVNYKDIEIAGNKVKIREGQEIITGSFIKAYAVDKLIERMKEIGINDAIVNAGGSTIMALNNQSHPAWQIIVNDPIDEDMLFNINISNECYSTSSQSKTYMNINGKQYGHILNPQTGFPSTNKQVGIVSNSCMVGDIISTGLFNETSTSFLDKMNRLTNHYKVEGFMIDENNETTYTKEFLNNYIQE